MCVVVVEEVVVVTQCESCLAQLTGVDAGVGSSTNQYMYCRDLHSRRAHD